MMKALIFNNWQRKVLAFVTAIVMWLFVNHSIIETKTIPNVPIRIVNLPPEKTVIGLLPNGILKRRVALTLTGSRDIIQELEPGDIEVVIDASMIDNDDWIVNIGKKNLVSLNPAIDLGHHIASISHTEFVIKLSQVVTAKIPITVMKPLGDPPKGYEYLDVWPRHLTQTMSGPAEEIQALKTKGLKLWLDLSKVTLAELEAIRAEQPGIYKDEISFPVPNKWKKVKVAYRNNAFEEINDPEADNLHIDFLKRDFIPIDREVPIRVFYPLQYSDKINPNTYSLSVSEKIVKRNGITLFTFPLYLRDVSRLFVDVVRDNIEIALVAAPKSVREVLEWSPEVVDPNELEDAYVARMMTHLPTEINGQTPLAKEREELLRNRFREFLLRTTLFITPNQKLSLETVLEDGHIVVK